MLALLSAAMMKDAIGSSLSPFACPAKFTIILQQQWIPDSYSLALKWTRTLTISGRLPTRMGGPQVP
jgi:hypothetical protein